jgi:dTDP-6-deoxy-L-talose 4-dehydrogenase (NAD+)
VRVAVTGAAGFIGAPLVRQLAASGAEVLALVRPGAKHPRLQGARARIHGQALEDGAALERWFAAERPEALVHLAWYARPSDYLVSRENLASLSTSLHVAEAALGAGCQKIVGVGTCLEYAAAERPFEEGDPVDPVSPYAAAKHAAWLVMRALAARAGAELAWARVFHLYGPRESESRLVPSVAASLRRGEPTEVTAGEQVRDYLHVDDVAAGLACLTQPGAVGVFNVCSGEGRPLRELLATLGRILGREECLRFGARPYAAGESMYLAGRSDRLRQLGWKPRFATMEDGLRDALGRGA